MLDQFPKGGLDEGHCEIKMAGSSSCPDSAYAIVEVFNEEGETLFLLLMCRVCLKRAMRLYGITKVSFRVL